MKITIAAHNSKQFSLFALNSTWPLPNIGQMDVAGLSRLNVTDQTATITGHNIPTVKQLYPSHWEF